MAGRGPAPSADRVGRSGRIRGDVNEAVGYGWQHGEIPPEPDGLMPASSEAWSTWMGAWFAAFWTPQDLPALRQVIRLYDQVERGEFQRAPELRLQMDTYGITPKGQQDRRWRPPADGTTSSPTVERKPRRYAHLKVVDECPGDQTLSGTTGSTSPASDTTSSNGGPTTSPARATRRKSSSSRRTKPGS